MSSGISNEEFEELSFEEQCKIVFQADFDKKADLVIRSQAPERLVGAFTAEELYLIAKEMDSSNLPELIRSADFNQLQFMSDFECWTGDAVNPKGFVEWLSYLQEAGDVKFGQWLVNADMELLITGFQKVMSVLKPFHEDTVDDIIGDQPYFTIDGLYYLMIDEDNHAVVKKAMSMLFEGAKHLYYGLLEGMLSESELIAEEDSYVKRLRRLSDRGFPEKEAAFSIYRFLSDREWQSEAGRGKDVSENVDPESLISYPVLWREEKLFVDDVFAGLASQTREKQQSIYQEFIWLCNKIIVCRGIDAFSQDEVKSAYEHARSILSLGFEVLSEGKVPEAQKIMTECWLEYVFRKGITVLLNLRRELEKGLKQLDDAERLVRNDFFPKPYCSMIRSLLQVIPVYDEHGESESERDFKNRADVRFAAGIVLGVNAGIGLLNEPFFRSIYENTVDVEGDAKVDFTMIFTTVFARFVVDGILSCEPLKDEDLSLFLADAFDRNVKDGDLPVLLEDVKSGFVKFLNNELNDLSEETFKSLDGLFKTCFDVVEEELRLIDIRQKLDSRFISCVMMKDE